MPETDLRNLEQDVPDHDRIIKLEGYVEQLVKAQEHTTTVLEVHNKRLMDLGYAQCKKLDEIKLLISDNTIAQKDYCLKRAEKVPTWGVLTWLLGIIVLAVIGSYGYTASIDIKSEQRYVETERSIEQQHPIVMPKARAFPQP